MPLANIQHAFMTNLLQSQNTDADFLLELSPLDALSKEMQLSIYRSNINGAYQKVLGQVYPACKNILGEDYFNQLCRSYRFEHPSREADLNVYGEQFSSFINKQLKTQVELVDFEYLVDLALLEWSWHASYFAINDKAFDFTQLAAIDGEDQDNIVFDLSYSLSIHATIYPILEMWQANRNVPDKNQEFSMPESEKYFCIARNNYEVLINELNEYQFVLLQSIGNRFSMAQLTEQKKIYNGNMQEQLLLFIQKGWVTGFSFPDNTSAM